jgi:Ribonuclease G/E
MTRRRLYLDEGVGEARGVVTLEGRPERLLIERESDVARQAAGAHVAARVRSVNRALGLAFLDLGEGPDAALPLRPEMGRLVEGQSVEIEIRVEARLGKGATARLVAEADGPPRLLAAAPGIGEMLQRFAPKEQVITGAPARAAADEAETEALESIFPLPGGGSIAVERTRALVAVDVDVGEREGTESKRAARAANLAALVTAARVLRLKGEGGLVVIDLAGRGHDGQALLAAARIAFAPDGGVAFGPVSRFGTLELTIPRRVRPIGERLIGSDGRPSAETLALRLIRAVETAASDDRGARIRALAAPDVAAAAAPYLKRLEARFGARLALGADAALAMEQFEITTA